jgi:hypothetical protein
MQVDPNDPNYVPSPDDTRGDNIDLAAPDAMGNPTRPVLPAVPATVPPVPAVVVPDAAPVAAAPVPAPPPAPDIKIGASSKGLPQTDDLEKMILGGMADQKQAIGDYGDAQQQAGAQTAQAFTDKADLQRQQAEEYARQAQYVRERQRALDDEDAANLKKAQEYVIPDFWGGDYGKMASAAISVGLGGAAAALLGSTQNTALQAIQHNVDQYAQQQKDIIDNRFKYAEQKGLLDDKMRAQYANSLVDLLQQHSMILASAADRVQAVTAAAKGNVDQKQAAYLASRLKAQAADQLEKARQLQITRYDAITGRINAGANVARVKVDAEKNRNDQTDKRLEAEATAAYAPIKKEHTDLTSKDQELATAEDLLKSGNSESIQQAKDLITRAATGGKITRYTDQAALKATGGVSTQVANAIESIVEGKPSEEAINVLLDTVKTSRASTKQGLDKLRSKYEGSLTANPIVSRAPDGPSFVKARSLGIFGAPETTVPSTPAIGSTSTSGGRTIVFTANGWQYK